MIKLLCCHRIIMCQDCIYSGIYVHLFILFTLILALALALTLSSNMVITSSIISLIIKYRQSMNHSRCLTTFKNHFYWDEPDPNDDDGDGPALFMANPNWHLEPIWLNTRNATFSKWNTLPAGTTHVITNFLVTEFPHLIKPAFIYAVGSSSGPPMKMTIWQLNLLVYGDQVATLPSNYYVQKLYL